MNNTPTNNPTPLTGHTVSHAQGAAEDRVEAAARAIAQLEPGEDWPTNESLGGSPTGTRDDEFRDACLDTARAALAAADAVEPAPVRGDAAGREALAALLEGHQQEVREAGDGYTAPREHWINCSCGATVWAWQQFYAETEVDSTAAWHAHLADALLAAGFVTGETSARPEHVVKAEALRELVAAIDLTGYGWTSVASAERFRDRLRVRADLIEAGESDGE